MADVTYTVEDGAWKRTVPTLSFPLPHKLSGRMWARMQPERRWDDDFRSDFLGVDVDGEPFYREGGGVGTHRVRVINGVPYLFEVS